MNKLCKKQGFTQTVLRGFKASLIESMDKSIDTQSQSLSILYMNITTHFHY